MDETSDLFCTTLLMMCDSLKPALLLLHLVVLRPFLSAIEQSFLITTQRLELVHTYILFKS